MQSKFRIKIIETQNNKTMSLPIPVPLKLIKESLLLGDIQAIANRYGCAHSTVSRAINGKTGKSGTNLYNDIIATAEAVGKLNNQKKLLLEPQKTEA